MVPGFTERECLAAELRRRELLERAAREQSVLPHGLKRTRTLVDVRGFAAAMFTHLVRWTGPVPSAPSGR